MDVFTSNPCCQFNRESETGVLSGSVWQAVCFPSGSRRSGILVESLTVSFFLGKGMKAVDLSHFCLSKIPQRLEVERLLVSAMLF